MKLMVLKDKLISAGSIAIIWIMVLVQSYIQNFLIYLAQAIKRDTAFAKDLKKFEFGQFYDLIMVKKLHFWRWFYIILTIILAIVLFIYLIKLIRSINKWKNYPSYLILEVPAILWIVLLILAVIFNQDLYHKLDESIITNPLVRKHSKVEFLICNSPISDLSADSTKLIFDTYKKNLEDKFDNNDTLRKIAKFRYDSLFCDSMIDIRKSKDHSFTVNVQTQILRINDKNYQKSDSMIFIQKLITNNLLIITYLALDDRSKSISDSTPLDFFPQLCVADLAVIPNLTWGLAQLTVNNFNAAGESIKNLRNSNNLFIRGAGLPKAIRNRFTCSNAETYYLAALTEYAQSILEDKSVNTRSDLLRRCNASLDSALSQIRSLKESMVDYHIYYTMNGNKRNYLEYKYLCLKLNVLIDLFLTTGAQENKIHMHDPCKYIINRDPFTDRCKTAYEIIDLYKFIANIIPMDKPTFKIHPVRIENESLVL